MDGVSRVDFGAGMAPLQVVRRALDADARLSAYGVGRGVARTPAVAPVAPVSGSTSARVPAGSTRPAIYL
ncbi:MAG: hypothetical protein M3Q27_05805 [Actinomycetota bacterium]|nr:hypothetical protein [Actinomycetota bacterium]